MNRRDSSSLFRGAAATSVAPGASAQTQAAPSDPIRRDWLDRRKEPILEPDELRFDCSSCFVACHSLKLSLFRHVQFQQFLVRRE
jgi:hypothetical protein